MILNHIIKTKEVDEMIKGVKHLRVKAGYDTDEAAEILDITKSTLYKIEQGHLNPSLKLLDRMRKAYKCTSDEILDTLHLEN